MSLRKVSKKSKSFRKPNNNGFTVYTAETSSNTADPDNSSNVGESQGHTAPLRVSDEANASLIN